ncbi:carboxyltransferase domain-containing protein [Alphaproteobacteria bacterium GH1-50]|uniref:Carboxyltransferase domain-containing protein n=1 Tax=Kangsaoukella pontilimi TaxID=2691042 RepID=A0A7C9NDL3_9RHOB|nr:allophanate hydrolase subunit 1 [Kangsaoukella pontilimi]MXQ07579.1 carboxyltransferase domain-containing protein [Kangsaoukella pontilimi]
MQSPIIRNAGYDGFIVTFGDRLGEGANRAALAFRDALEQAGLDGLEETSTSLVSAYLRFDPLTIDHDDMRARLEALLKSRDWEGVALPHGRRLWRVPAAFDPEVAPHLDDAAELAGFDSRDEAVRSICGQPVRVQTIGFAPGMPYLGQLPECWDIPRRTTLTDNVPAAAICVAIRQLVLFPNMTPTGWRHIGQTRLKLFRPQAEEPFILRPGDEILFVPVSLSELDGYKDDPDGGAVAEALE